MDAYTPHPTKFNENTPLPELASWIRHQAKVWQDHMRATLRISRT